MDTHFENLSIILAGPIPPNPSELTVLEKTNELIRLLKEKYECIVIDSSPIGIASDVFQLATLADTCILVVRQNMTLKDLLEDTVKELKISDIKSLSVAINDLGLEYKRYSYGGKYGYK
jgi:Mrp family chromosome partitioning ATPase